MVGSAIVETSQQGSHPEPYTRQSIDTFFFLEYPIGLVRARSYVAACPHFLPLFLLLLLRLQDKR